MIKRLICFIFTLIVTLTFVGCSSNKVEVSKLEKQISELQTEVDKLTNEKKVSEEVPSQNKGSSSEKIITVEENNQQNSEVKPKQKSSSGDNSQQNSKQNETKKGNTSQKTTDYSDWVPISTDNLNDLLDSIKKGYVVYYNGQYLGSPEYIKMITSEEVVYMHDVAPKGGGEGTDRNILAPDTKLIYETEEEVTQDITKP